MKNSNKILTTATLALTLFATGCGTQMENASLNTPIPGTDVSASPAMDDMLNSEKTQMEEAKSMVEERKAKEKKEKAAAEKKAAAKKAAEKKMVAEKKAKAEKKAAEQARIDAEKKAATDRAAAAKKIAAEQEAARIAAIDTDGDGHTDVVEKNAGTSTTDPSSWPGKPAPVKPAPAPKKTTPPAPAPAAPTADPAPAAAPIAAPAKAAPKKTEVAPASGGMNWGALAECESGGNASTNSGNGYYGAYQFSLPTWQSVGGSGLPSDASLAEQTARAQQLLNAAGPGQWPVCGANL